MTNSPPKRAQRFLQRFLREDIAEEVLGDLGEKFYVELKRKSVFRAKLNYWYQVINYMRPFALRKSRSVELNHYTMYRSYIKVGWRNLLKNKIYSSINIIGLATGMAVAMLIGLWIWDELSFDSYFHNRDRLAQVMVLQTNEGITYTGGSIQMPLGDALRTNYAADFKAVSLASWNDKYIVSTGVKKLSGMGMWVQSDFPDMFTLNMLSGTRDALKDPSSILLSSSLAKAIFGNEDAINRTVRLDNRMDLTVRGVYEDFPHNTTFHETQLFLPWANKENWRNTQEPTTNWMNHCGQLFVQLSDQADFNGVNEKIRSVPTPHIEKWKEEAMVHPLSKVHLYNQFENGKASGGRIQFVWLFGIIGVFVLLLACINFMNLSTARSERRAKEVGIRKTIGSVRSQLIGQFLSESLVVTGLAFIFSLIFVQLSLPFFNALAGKQISIAWNNPVFWSLVLGFTVITSVVSGSYPAFYLSSFKPVKVLKGVFKAGRFAALPRKALVVVQFTVSITLIICTLIVFRQIQFAKNRSAGFARDGLITVGISTPELRKHIDAIKNELIQKGAVENMALSSQSPAHFGNNNGIDWRGKDPEFVIFFRNVGVTPDYGKTIGWTMKKGRDFSADMLGDSSSIIINEKAAEIMGFEDPLGEVVKFWGRDYTIIGVTGDMQTQSPYEPSTPSFFITNDWMSVIVIRLKNNLPVREALAEIEPVFKKYDPESPFEFNFVDEAYARKFSNEERIGKLAAFFTSLAVFISCLGLFGLASFVAEQRTKEIGIRKVLGASVGNLWRMLSKDFVILVVIACCISAPIAFYFMNDWLMQFQYKTTISWQIFATAILGAVTITLLTVSYQAIKAAVANPVNSLKSE